MRKHSKNSTSSILWLGAKKKKTAKPVETKHISHFCQTIYATVSALRRLFFLEKVKARAVFRKKNMQFGFTTLEAVLNHSQKLRTIIGISSLGGNILLSGGKYETMIATQTKLEISDMFQDVLSCFHYNNSFGWICISKSITTYAMAHKLSFDKMDDIVLLLDGTEHK
ncbi:hypothetical protein ACJX0J_029775 [Zea mays]